jgi:hypothetical protein
MAATWTPDQLERIGAAEELELATRRPDGTAHKWVPIWVVAVDGQVYVRTWHRRTTGWFGRVLTEPRARIRVPGLEADVTVEDVGEGPGQLRSSVDEAYRMKYGRYGQTTVGQMVSDAAAAATLRLFPS